MFTASRKRIFACSFNSDEKGRDNSAVPCMCGDDPMASALWYSAVICSPHSRGKAGMYSTGIPALLFEGTSKKTKRKTWQVHYDTLLEYHRSFTQPTCIECKHFLLLCHETTQPDCANSPAVNLPTSYCFFWNGMQHRGIHKPKWKPLKGIPNYGVITISGGSPYGPKFTTSRAGKQALAHFVPSIFTIHSYRSVLPQGSRLNMSCEPRFAMTSVLTISSHMR